MPQTAMADRVLSQQECATLFQRIVHMTNGQGDTVVAIDGTWRGYLRWAKNRTISSGDTRNHVVSIRRKIRGAWGIAALNQLDDDSLRYAMTIAERGTLWHDEVQNAPPTLLPQTILRPDIFQSASYQLLAQQRAEVAQQLVRPVQDAGKIAAGYLEATAKTYAVYNTTGMAQYYTATNVQYSVTVRDTKGTASGWAGLDHHDWGKIDPGALTKRALQKCLDSENSRGIEPGRYTTILEPQAVHQLMSIVIAAFASREYNEARPDAPLFYGEVPGIPVSVSKIGMPILDPRITLQSNPIDPVGGYLPFILGHREGGSAHRAVTWIEKGVLRELAYDEEYGAEQLHGSHPLPSTMAYRMSGGNSSIEEMIRTTDRGILVTRFGGVELLDRRSGVCVGVTRDGLWLIENGKITMPVKNMRFIESPFFVFNNLESLGTPTRVFSPESPAVVPPAKVRDFTFASTADAV